MLFLAVGAVVKFNFSVSIITFINKDCTYMLVVSVDRKVWSWKQQKD